MERWSIGVLENRIQGHHLRAMKTGINRDSLMYGPSGAFDHYSNTPINLGILMAELSFSDPRNQGGFYVRLNRWS